MTVRDPPENAVGDTDATIIVRPLGTCAYEATRDAMIAFTRARNARSSDEIWLLEHPPVYTLGQAGRIAHLLRDVGIPVVKTERGGQITYHGPGQLIAYLLIDLKRRGIKVREFVRLIESALVAVLAAYNLPGETKPGAPGIYMERDGVQQKVAALGLKIVDGRSFHGLCLNVAMDLSPYDHIDACGYPGLRSIDLAAFGLNETPQSVGPRLATELVARIEAATH